MTSRSLSRVRKNFTDSYRVNSFSRLRLLNSCAGRRPPRCATATDSRLECGRRSTGPGPAYRRSGRMRACSSSAARSRASGRSPPSAAPEPDTPACPRSVRRRNAPPGNPATAAGNSRFAPHSTARPRPHRTSRSDLEKVLRVQPMPEVRDEADVLLRRAAQVENRQPGLIADITEELLEPAARTGRHRFVAAPTPRGASGEA